MKGTGKIGQPKFSVWFQIRKSMVIWTGIFFSMLLALLVFRLLGGFG